MTHSKMETDFMTQERSWYIRTQIRRETIKYSYHKPSIHHFSRSYYILISSLPSHICSVCKLTFILNLHNI